MAASDGTLVLGVRNGDRSAFAELYDRRARLIRAICYDETRHLQSAADLTQEVFLRAYKNLGHLHDPNCFATWLIGIARQVCREWRRKRGASSAGWPAWPNNGHRLSGPSIRRSNGSSSYAIRSRA